jgi:hypothetical protein
MRMSRSIVVAASSPADLAGRAALSTRKHAAALSDEIVKRLEVAHVADWLLDHEAEVLPAAAEVAREALEILADAWNRADAVAVNCKAALREYREADLELSLLPREATAAWKNAEARLRAARVDADALLAEGDR